METARPILDKAKRLAKINTKFYVCLTFSPILMLILWMVRRWQYRRSLISLCMKFELVDNDRYAGSSSQLLENSSIHLQWLPNSSFILRHDSFFASYHATFRSWEWLASPSTVVHLRVERCPTWWMRSSNAGVFEHRARRVNREKWTHDVDVAYHLWLWYPFFKFHTFRVEVGSTAFEFLSDNHCSAFFWLSREHQELQRLMFARFDQVPTVGGGGEGWKAHPVDGNGWSPGGGWQPTEGFNLCWDGWWTVKHGHQRYVGSIWGSRAPERHPFVTMWKCMFHVFQSNSIMVGNWWIFSGFWPARFGTLNCEPCLFHMRCLGPLDPSSSGVYAKHSPTRGWIQL